MYDTVCSLCEYCYVCFKGGGSLNFCVRMHLMQCELYSGVANCLAILLKVLLLLLDPLSHFPV